MGSDFRWFCTLAIIAFVAVCLLGWAMIQPATGQEQFNLHPDPNGQAHWYSNSCCNLNDCAAVQMRFEDDHYVWQSWRFPGFEVRVPFGDKRVKRSQDGRFHGCEKPIWEAGAIIGVEAICVYQPDST